MNENEIGIFAAKLSAFRAGLNGDEREILDRVMKVGRDDVEAHAAVRNWGITFELEGEAYRFAPRAYGKDTGDDEVVAHRFKVA